MNAAPTTRGDGPSQRNRWAAAGAVAAVLVVSAVAWVINPSTFGEYGNVYQASAEPGSAVHIDAGLTADRVVELREVRPVPGEGSAPFDATIVVCPPGSVGVVSGDIEEHCPGVRSASGTRLETAEQVVVTVTPEERGRVVIEGFEVTYRDGIRLGSQRSGARIEVATPEDAPSE